jgi:hypothetical protein
MFLFILYDGRKDKLNYRKEEATGSTKRTMGLITNLISSSKIHVAT